MSCAIMFGMVKVYDWAPNGCNDIEFIDENGEVQVECNALFGVDVMRNHPVQSDDGESFYCYMTRKDALEYVAASPVDDGSRIAVLLSKGGNVS